MVDLANGRLRDTRRFSPGLFNKYQFVNIHVVRNEGAPASTAISQSGPDQREGLVLPLHQQRTERTNLQRIVTGSRFGPPTANMEQSAIVGLWRTARHHPANSVFRAADGVRLITNGWAGWLRYGFDGRQSIFLFLIPGDFIVPGLFEPGCCDLVALTPLRTVDASGLCDGLGGSTPQTAALIGESGRYYRRLLIDHLTRLTTGCTSRSVAHLLSEFHARSVRAGTFQDNRFSLPIGQRVIGRSIGRSTVQVHKVMNKFQKDGLLTVGYDWVEMHQPDELKALAGLTHGDASLYSTSRGRSFMRE